MSTRAIQPSHACSDRYTSRDGIEITEIDNTAAYVATADGQGYGQRATATPGSEATLYESVSYRVESTPDVVEVINMHTGFGETLTGQPAADLREALVLIPARVPADKVTEETDRYLAQYDDGAWRSRRPTVGDELNVLVAECKKTAWGDSNDEEIDALRALADAALRAAGYPELADEL
jgi:hypothetical protein